ncbi:MAG: hypothetical protein ACK5Q5_23825 [Planctomycetaceae bacterium]
MTTGDLQMGRLQVLPNFGSGRLTEPIRLAQTAACHIADGIEHFR